MERFSDFRVRFHSVDRLALEILMNLAKQNNLFTVMLAEVVAETRYVHAVSPALLIDSAIPRLRLIHTFGH